MRTTASGSAFDAGPPQLGAVLVLRTPTLEKGALTKPSYSKFIFGCVAKGQVCKGVSLQKADQQPFFMARVLAAGRRDPAGALHVTH